MTAGKPELVTPALAALLDFWLARCADGGIPDPTSISPIDLRPWSKNIVIFEVIGGNNFVYTYYGAALAAAYGQSRLGATLEALPNDQRRVLAAEYDEVQRHRRPISRIHTADFGTGPRSWERLVLPLAGTGETVDKLLVAAYELPSTDNASLPGVPA